MSKNPYNDGYKEGYKDGAKGVFGNGGERNPHSDLNNAMTWDDGYSKGHISGTHKDSNMKK